MMARLMKSPWDGNIFPVGLTLNKEYRVTEVFNVNANASPYSKYFRIIDDNNDEIAWCSELFEVTIKRPADILAECMSVLKSMSEEDFNEAIKTKGIAGEDYLIEKFTDDTFHIVLNYSKE